MTFITTCINNAHAVYLCKPLTLLHNYICFKINTIKKESKNQFNVKFFLAESILFDIIVAVLLYNTWLSNLQ